MMIRSRRTLKQDMVVVNKRGGGGALAMNYFMTRPADGNTIMTFTVGHAMTMAKGKTKLKVADMAIQFEESGVDAVVVTEIERDGTLLGPDTLGLEEVLNSTTLEVIASGGVGSLQDLETLVQLKANNRSLGGVIVGKSLYEKKIDLTSALNICETMQLNKEES